MDRQESHKVQQGEVPSATPGEEQPHTPVHAGGCPAGKHLDRKGPVVLADTKLNMSPQCALAAKASNDVLGCITQNIASRLREVILPLFSAPDILERVQQSATTKMFKELEYFSCEQRLSDLGLFSLEVRRLAWGESSM